MGIIFRIYFDFDAMRSLVHLFRYARRWERERLLRQMHAVEIIESLAVMRGCVGTDRNSALNDDPTTRVSRYLVKVGQIAYIA